MDGDDWDMNDEAGKSKVDEDEEIEEEPAPVIPEKPSEIVKPEEKKPDEGKKDDKKEEE